MAYNAKGKDKVPIIDVRATKSRRVRGAAPYKGKAGAAGSTSDMAENKTADFQFPGKLD